MLLEELCLSIHMRAIEYTVAVNLLILERGGLLSGKVRVSLIPQVVFVRLQIVFLWLLLLIEFFLMLGVSLIEGTLKFAKTVGEVAEDVGATDLHKRFIPCFEEDHELLVHVPKYMVTQNLINTLPVLSNHALLIEIDIIALKISGVLPTKRY